MEQNQLIAVVVIVIVVGGAGALLLLQPSVESEDLSYYASAEGDFTYVDVYKVTSSDGSDYEQLLCHITEEYTKKAFLINIWRTNSLKIRCYVYNNNNQTSFDFNVVKGSKITIDQPDGISLTFSFGNSDAAGITAGPDIMTLIIIGGLGIIVCIILILFLLRGSNY